MSEILVPVSFGELLDKIAILQIKSERMTDAAKLANVRNELSALDACSGPWGPGQVGSRVATAPRTSVSSPNVQRSTSTVCSPCTRSELAPFAASTHQPDPATAAGCVNVG